MKTVIKKQTCRACREKFSNELNYNLYTEFGFKTRENFEKHSSRNKNCPCKLSNITTDESDKEVNIQTQSTVKWLPYEKYINDDYNDYKESIMFKEKFHNKPGKNGRILWFNESKKAASSILLGIQDPDVRWISLCAEPGSGKTAVIHKLIHDIMTFNLPLLQQENITLTTGMSDTDWYEQTLNNFRLRDKRFLWEELNERNETFCIVHRSNFNKRITNLANNLKKMSNHIFIIDESHFADDVKMTFDKELKRLGLTKERMKEYNIKMILVSATPDVNLSIFSRDCNHRLVILQNGPGYKGFDFYNKKKMIKNYDENLDLEKFIRQNYSSPRYHFIRARTQQEKGEYRTKLKEVCKSNNWIFKEDDSDNNFYISHENNNNEKSARQNVKQIITTYQEPQVHTFILIKNKYQASKRLKLTKYVGVISEKPSKKADTSITCNGLIARFFGYPDLPNFINDETPIFLCNKKCIIEYLDFVHPEKPFIYTGIDYTSRRLISKENSVYERSPTTYSNLNDSNLENKSKYSKDNINIIKRDTYDELKLIFEKIDYKPKDNLKEKNSNGFIEATIRSDKFILSDKEIEDLDVGLDLENLRIYPYYTDKKDNNTLKWCFIIKKESLNDKKLKKLGIHKNN